MQIYDLLKTDHDKVKDLLTSIEKKQDSELFQQLKKEMIIHNEAEEEEVFYRRLHEKAGNLKIIVTAGNSEHELVIKMLKQLDKIENKEEWLQLFSVVKKSIEAHITMEEQNIFALAKKHFSNQEAEDIGSKMADNKQKLLKKYND